MLEQREFWFPWEIGTEEMEEGAEVDSVELCSFTHESPGTYYPLSLGNGLWPETPESCAYVPAFSPITERSFAISGSLDPTTMPHLAGEVCASGPATHLRGLCTECQPRY